MTSTADIIDRVPPSNLEAERGVLASMLLDSSVCDDVSGIVTADDFYADANRKLFVHVTAMHADGERVDAILLCERLRSSGDLEAIGDEGYLGEVFQSSALAANGPHYAKIVRDKAMLRSAIHAGESILRGAYDESAAPEEILGLADKAIAEARDRRSGNGPVRLGEVLVDLAAEFDNPTERGTAIATGFDDLDHKLGGGLHGGEVVVIAARTATGKTALALNIADNVTAVGTPTLFVSMEMTRSELAKRLLCSKSGVMSTVLRRGTLADNERQAVSEASRVLHASPLFIDDSESQTVGSIGAAARQIQRRHGLGLVVIDYLQLVKPSNRREPREQQVAGIAREVKGLAKQLGVPIILLAQLNRQAESSKDGRPKLSHLRESGAIEQDADLVLLLSKDSDEPTAAGLMVKMIVDVAKQRSGPTGEVALYWDAGTMTFKPAVISEDPF